MDVIFALITLFFGVVNGFLVSIYIFPDPKGPWFYLTLSLIALQGLMGLAAWEVRTEKYGLFFIVFFVILNAIVLWELSH